MKSLLSSLALVSLFWPGVVSADTILYDNTVTPTFDTVFYSVGPYLALGDQIALISPGIADQAEVELFNDGGAGTFDLDLDLFDVGSPVGSLLGSAALSDIRTGGGDVLDLTFSLPDVTVPQDVIFTVSVNNQNPDDPTAPIDLGVDMFEPPDVGSSDNTFMIAEEPSGQYIQLTTTSENVYFQLSGTPVTTAPDPATVTLSALGLLGVVVRSRRRLL